MFKARLHKQDGTAVLLLGLEGENMARLMSDEPIRISHLEMSMILGVGALDPMPPFEIVIVGAKDQEALLEMMRPLMGKNTIVHGEG